MAFDYDPGKSAANKAKHGIDFVDAQALWEDANRLEAPAKSDGEPRFIVIGKIGGKHGSAICTERKEEIDRYESP